MQDRMSLCDEMQNPDSKVHGTSMGPIWDRQDPGGPHAGPMKFVIWEHIWQVFFTVV